MAKTTTMLSASSSPPKAYQWALGTAVYLSIFMSLVTFMLPIPSETVDSRDKVKEIQAWMKNLLETTLEAPPSVTIMTNFIWPKEDGEEVGLPVLDAWTSLWWFRKFHTHFAVTTTWLVLAPIQVASLGGQRLYSRKWHRRLGYVFVITSCCIAMGLVEIIYERKVYGEPHWLAMVLNIMKWIYFVTSLFLAIWWPKRQTQHYTAQQRMQQHKKWILRHVAMGYSVAFQRFLMFVAGPMLHALLWTWNENLRSNKNNTDVTPMPRMLRSIEMQQWYNVTTIVAMTAIPLLVEWAIIQRPWFEPLGITGGKAASATTSATKTDPHTKTD